MGRSPGVGDLGKQGAPCAAGFVLAGGRSSRMGQDKALVELGGEPLIALAIRTLRGAGLAVTIAGARSALDSFAPVLPDSYPDLGPLSGICAALAKLERQSSSPATESALTPSSVIPLPSAVAAPDYAVFLPVDLPLLPSNLVVHLLRHAQLTRRAVTLSSVNGLAQTFPVILRRDTLPLLERELGSGRLGCLAGFLSAARGLEESPSILPVEVLVQAGQVLHPKAIPAAMWFLNINTQSDLRRVSALLRLA